MIVYLVMYCVNGASRSSLPPIGVNRKVMVFLDTELSVAIDIPLLASLIALLLVSLLSFVAYYSAYCYWKVTEN